MNNDILSIPEAVLSAFSIVSKIRPTFCSMWIGRIRRALAEAGAENGDSHFTAHGVVSYFTTPEDGQRYRVVVEPVRE